MIELAVEGSEEKQTFEATNSSFRFYNNFHNQQKLIENTAYTILEMLVSIGYIMQADFVNIDAVIEENENGEILCYLENATTFQNQLFLEALSEVFDPIENPRYLLCIDRDAVTEFDQPFYLNVPTIFSKNKKDATAFSDFWQLDISINRLIYTRTQEGRLELLKARNVSLNPEFINNCGL